MNYTTEGKFILKVNIKVFVIINGCPKTKIEQVTNKNLISGFIYFTYRIFI